MDYLATWRSRLPAAMAEIAASTGNPDISLQYGVLAGGALWAVREDAASAELHAALRAIVGDDLGPLPEFLSGLPATGPSDFARDLTALAGSQAWRAMLDRLVLYFLDDFLRLGLLHQAPADITVQGDVSGANVVINSRQYIGGDLVVTAPRAWSCPTAPNPPPHFAGRREELDRLAAALAGGRSVAVTGVQGMGGIGKTALVLRAAAELKDFGAVLWASLGPEPTVVNHLVGWARHGDESFEAGDSTMDVLAVRVNSVLTQLVRDHCPGRVLVILDDVWEGESVAAARILQRAAPAGAAYLITTRSQRVVAQMRSTGLELGPMLPADALRMLRNLLEGLPDVTDTDLTALAAAVGHHPLALELAAGQVQLRERPAAEIGDLIANYERGVPAGSPFGQIDLELGETREDNLAVVLAYSYDSLAEADRADFRALGILAYGVPFHADTCAAIWHRSAPSGLDAASGLDALRHRALLTIAREVGWYQQHQLLRAYARALLDLDQAERAAVTSRYTAHIVGVTGEFAGLSGAGWRPLEPFLPHVEEAGSILVAAVAGDPQDAVTEDRGLTFAANVRHLLVRRRELRHPEWLEMGLTVARTRHDLGYVSLFLDELGKDELFRGAQQEAIKRWAEAREIAERAGDRPSMAATYVGLGNFFLYSDPENTPGYLRKAIALYEELGDTDGVITALLLLAQWHMTLFAPHRQRAAGEGVLLRAIEVASGAGKEEGAAEARLQLGRLYDTTGRRAAAVELLAETTGQLRSLGRADLEALALLFSASATAALGRLDDADACLRAAIPLFRSTGHGPGHATALRNLAELTARQGDQEAALGLFAEALPLVRLVTMEFLNTDDHDSEVAPPFFSAQYEDVAKLDLVEAFRARLGREIELDQGPVRGAMPQEFLYYLLRETQRAILAGGAARTAWMSALDALETRLAAHAPAFDPELALAGALRRLSGGQPPDLDEGNRYGSELQYLSARIAEEQTRQGQPQLDAEECRLLASNTLAAHLFERDQAPEWSRLLRRQRRYGGLWGDEQERDYYDALLRVLNGRLAALPSGNPYRVHLSWLFDQQGEYIPPPVELLLRETVAAALAPEQRGGGLLADMRAAAAEAAVLGLPGEAEFFDVLATLAAGEDGQLPPGNLFAADCERARAAIAAASPLLVPLTRAELQHLVRLVTAARTTAPKSVITAGMEIAERQQEAARVLDEPAFNFVVALGMVLEGQPASLPPGSPYADALDLVVAQISAAAPVPPGSDQLPQELVNQLADAATTAVGRSGAPADAAAEWLASCRESFAARGPEWSQETAFADALLAIVAGRPPDMQPGSPYSAALEQAAATSAQHRQVRTAGGQLEPATVDALLRQTAENLTRLKAAMERFGVENFAEMLTGTEFPRLVEAQRDWAIMLGEREAELTSAGAADEAAFFRALIDITDTQPVTLPRDNPYYTVVSNLLTELDYAPGIPADLQISALAGDSAAHREEFFGVFSGRNEIVSHLDELLTLTVYARTGEQENRELVRAEISRTRERIAPLSAQFESRGAQPEIELLDALIAVIDDGSPTLPPDHPYRAHLDNVERAIAVSDATAPEPGQLTFAELAQLCLETGSALSGDQDQRAAWLGTLRQLREDAVAQHLSGEVLALLESLSILTEGRPADLPLTNRYRPYLRMTSNMSGPSAG
jgi:tetratricopeptide (TPR) repeat protein